MSQRSGPPPRALKRSIGVLELLANVSGMLAATARATAISARNQADRQTQTD